MVWLIHHFDNNTGSLMNTAIFYMLPKLLKNKNFNLIKKLKKKNTMFLIFYSKSFYDIFYFISKTRSDPQ